MNYTRALALMIASTSFNAALAQEHIDIGLGIANNHIVTGEIGAGVFTPGTRVFGSDFGELLPNFTDEPGFDCLPGTFPTTSSISFKVLSHLRAWNGEQFADDAPAELISIGFGPITPLLTPTTNSIVQGFSLAVSSNGEWHRHLEYTLLDPAADGVYLLELSLVGDHPSMQESLPFFLVFNQNMPEAEHDEAIDWVVNNLLNEPCAPDCDASGGLNIDDFICFQTLYALGDPAADCDATGTLNIDDFICFQTLFALGC